MQLIGKFLLLNNCKSISLRKELCLINIHFMNVLSKILMTIIEEKVAELQENKYIFNIIPEKHAVH